MFSRRISVKSVGRRLTSAQVQRFPKRTSPTVPTTTLAAVALHLQAVNLKGRSKYMTSNKTGKMHLLWASSQFCSIIFISALCSQLHSSSLSRPDLTTCIVKSSFLFSIGSSEYHFVGSVLRLYDIDTSFHLPLLQLFHACFLFAKFNV